MIASANENRTSAQRGNVAVAAALGVALLGVATSVWLAWQPCAADGCVDAATERADATRSSAPGAQVSEDPAPEFPEPRESPEATDAAGRETATPKARALRRQRDHVALLAPGEPTEAPLRISDPAQAATPAEEPAGHAHDAVVSANERAAAAAAGPEAAPPAVDADPSSGASANGLEPAAGDAAAHAQAATADAPDIGPAANGVDNAGEEPPREATLVVTAQPTDDPPAGTATRVNEALADAATRAQEATRPQDAAPAADAVADAASPMEDGIADAAPPTADDSAVDPSVVMPERAAPASPTPVGEAAGAAALESSLADARLAAATAPPPAEPPTPDAAAALAPTPQTTRGPADLSGLWDLSHAIDTTTYLPYLGLRMGYRVRLRQEGDKLVGTGERLSENGRVLPAGERTPISLEGKVVGRSVTLRFTEQGSGGKSGGVINWQLGGDGERVDGIFASSAARSSGLSKARRVAGR